MWSITTALRSGSISTSSFLSCSAPYRSILPFSITSLCVGNTSSPMCGRNGHLLTCLQSSHSTYMAKQWVQGMYSSGLRPLLRFATISCPFSPLSPYYYAWSSPGSSSVLSSQPLIPYLLPSIVQSVVLSCVACKMALDLTTKITCLEFTLTIMFYFQNCDARGCCSNSVHGRGSVLSSFRCEAWKVLHTTQECTIHTVKSYEESTANPRKIQRIP